MIGSLRWATAGLEGRPANAAGRCPPPRPQPRPRRPRAGPPARSRRREPAISAPVDTGRRRAVPGDAASVEEATWTFARRSPPAPAPGPCAWLRRGPGQARAAGVEVRGLRVGTVYLSGGRITCIETSGTPDLSGLWSPGSTAGSPCGTRRGRPAPSGRRVPPATSSRAICWPGARSPPHSRPRRPLRQCTSRGLPDPGESALRLSRPRRGWEPECTYPHKPGRQGTAGAVRGR